MPTLPDHWNVLEASTPDFPFRLITAPARHFLNSSFSKTPTSLRREKQPSILINPSDAQTLKITNGDFVRVINERGELEILVEIFSGVAPGVLVIESIWPNDAFKGGLGVNVLTGSDPAGPVGGATFHDNRVNLAAIT